MKAGWNPIRRNRKIGTKDHGFGQNNHLVIPESWHSLKTFCEKLSPCDHLVCEVNGHEILFIVQHTKPDWFYPCTVADIRRVLEQVPVQDVSLIDFIVLRQSTCKQRILQPAWGRARYYFEVDSQRNGQAIILEACKPEPYQWQKKFFGTPDRLRELARLIKDGHEVRKERRSVLIRPDVESLRNTVLYRTLLHEVGHLVDFARRIDEDGESTAMEKEDFAHRYATETFDRLKKAGIVPFTRILEPDVLHQDGLRLQDFQLEQQDQ